MVQVHSHHFLVHHLAQLALIVVKEHGIRIGEPCLALIVLQAPGQMQLERLQSVFVLTACQVLGRAYLVHHLNLIV